MTNHKIITVDANRLLIIDGIVNVLWGLLLAFYPKGVIRLLGIPLVEPPFYASILGAVLFGIGLALFIEVKRPAFGLGLGGAMAINVCGAICLGLWLLLTDLQVPVHGKIVMWALVVILLGLSAIELKSMVVKERHQESQREK